MLGGTIKAGLGLITCVVVFAVTTAAQAAPSQLRFSVSPGASDPVWKTPGVKFEKRGECSFKVPGVAASPMIAGRGAASAAFAAKAPLFNPGLPKPDGTYDLAPDDGFNTLFINLTLPGDPNSVMTCRGTILANGVDVGAVPSGGWPSATLMQIGGSGPLTVKPVLDRAKLAMADPTQKVLRRGQAVLVQEQVGTGPATQLAYLDLDTGALTRNEAISEFFVHLTVFEPNRVMVMPFGDRFGEERNTKSLSNRTDDGFLAVCKQEAYSTQNIYLRNAAGATDQDFLCIKTTEGHLAMIRKLAGKQTATPLPGGLSKQRIEHTFDYIVWK